MNPEQINEQVQEKVSEVKDLLIKKERFEATEILVEIIKSRSSIKSIRGNEHTEMWIYNNGIYEPFARTYIKEALRMLLGNIYTTQLANQVMDKIEADTYIDSKDFFKHTNTEEIVINNGIINLITRKIRKFNKEEIFFTKLPIEYNPKAKCKNWDKHLNNVLKHSEEDSKVLAEVFGHCLLPEYRIEKSIMLTGGGRNGKSKTLEVLKKVLGPQNVVNIPLKRLEEDQFSIYELYGKLANIGADLDSTALKNTATFKGLTGRDMQTAPRKFLPPVNFVNNAKFLFSANNLPMSYDNSPAFWGRWVLLEFPYTFIPKDEYKKISKEDKDKYKIADSEIIKKLSSSKELSGILNWALDGLDRLLKNGDYSTSQSTNEMKKMWIRKADSFRAFLDDNVEFDDVSFVEDYIVKDDLRQKYAKYCHDNNVKPQSDKGMRITLMECGVSEVRKSITYDNSDLIKPNQVQCWLGIKFKNSKDSKDSKDFTTPIENVNSDMGSKKLSTLSNPTIEKYSERKKYGMIDETEVVNFDDEVL